MVNIIHCSWDEFLRRTKSSRIFCFGAGKMFARFLKENPSIRVEGVIDNFCPEPLISLPDGGRKVTVFSFEEFLKKYHTDADVIVLITSQNYKEMVMQLDEADSLAGMDCYLQILMEDRLERKEEMLYFLKDGRKAEKKEPSIVPVGNRFQICDVLSLYDSNAGSKAPFDVQKVAERLGYKRIDIHFLTGGNKETNAQKWSIQQNRSDWEECYNMLPKKSILLVQIPCRQLQEARHDTILRLRREKNIKIIALIHDIESLRVQYNDETLQQDFNFMVKNADFFIVHTLRMKEYFIKTFGVSADRVTSLDLFDYLMEYDRVEQVKFERAITVAGNLDPFKSKYVYKLKDLRVKLNLFGSGYKEEMTDSNVTYHGVFPVDKIPFVLSSGFGLVWDGDSLETCAGYTGRYLRYNSPHKCSLYLAAGLPVIVWKEAAVAGFVQEHGVGIAVSSLFEVPEILESMTEERYNEYLENLVPVSKALREGANTKGAIVEAERYLGIS